jgi:lipoprotein-anchoring transpeptidase ErfK/SrfK
MLTRVLFSAFVILAIAGFGYAQHSDTPGKPPVQDQDTMTRLQIYLDEDSFGPGKGIGIHGADSPETIGRSGSHGCVRLANWDAARLVKQVTVGMTVEIQ